MCNTFESVCLPKKSKEECYAMSKRVLMLGLSGVIVFIVVGLVIYLYFSNSTSAHIHSMKHIADRMPTCTTDGNFEHWFCEDCGKLFWDAHGMQSVNDRQDLVWKAQHDLYHHQSVLPTCATTGVKEYWHCKQCDTYYLDSNANIATTYQQLILPIIEHQLQYQPYRSSTCTENGNIEHFQCVMCQQCFADEDATTILPTDSILLPLAEHSYKTHEAVAPTCITTGNIKYQQCTQCNSYFVDGVEVSYDQIILDTTPHIQSSYYQFDDKSHCSLCYFCNQSYDCHEHNYDDNHCKECGYVSGSAEKLLYTWRNGGYYVVGVPPDAKDIAIPYKYNGEYVLGIAQYAFAGSQINNVIISKGVVHIEQCAFVNCTNLQSVMLPDSIVSIGKSAFQNCTSLKSIDIPSSVVTIADMAYAGCNNVTSVRVHNNNYYNDYNGCLIDSVNRRLIYASNSATLPTDGSVTTIGAYAWLNSKITQLCLPNTVSAIEEYAFYGSRLQSINIPNSVLSIEEYAFANTLQLTSVILGDKVQSIRDFAFYNSALTTIYYCGTILQWQEINLYYNAISKDVDIFYYSSTQPSIEGNFWHWDNGLAVRW